MKLQTFALLAILSLIAAEESGQVYCGRRLAQTLGYICASDYLVKRSGYPLPYEVQGLEWKLEFPWVERAKAQSLHGGRGKRLVADECCLKPCTIDELLAYC